MKKLLFTLLLLVPLTGCSMGMGQSKYSCNGLPSGVQCKSALEVYELTEYQNSLTEISDQETAAKEKNGSKDAPASRIPVDPKDYAIKNLKSDAPIPIRTPSGVMRASIAPWEDSAEKLHTGEKVYVEIEKRKWAIGEQSDNENVRLHPLEVRKRNSNSSSKNNRGSSKTAERVDLSTMKPILPTPEK